MLTDRLIGDAVAATRLDRGDDAALNDEVDGVARSVCHPDLAGHRDHHPGPAVGSLLATKGAHLD